MILEKRDTLPRGDLGASCVHLCCDMQRMFMEHTEWQTPWMPRVLPLTRRLAEAHPERTIFTRFIPASRAGEGSGTWKDYFERWTTMTIERMAPGMVDLVDALARLVPPAEVIDKRVYSPWMDGALHERLQARGADSVIVSGSETDVCVLATVLGAVDRGYRVVVAVDAICSSADATHDASIQLYNGRYGMQVETASTAQILAHWRP